MRTLLKLNTLVMIVCLFIAPHLVQAQEIAIIQIPAIEVEASVIPLVIRQMPQGATWDTRQLLSDVGYLTGTGWFGQNRNVVLGGHAETVDRQENTFYNLNLLQVGDTIVVHTDGTIYTYAVASLEWVDPSDLTSVLPTGHDQLTLITCDTNSFDGSLYQQRLVVRALPA